MSRPGRAAGGVAGSTAIVLEPGVVVSDRFEVLSVAGWGASGAVHRARDRRDGGLVALKTLEALEERALKRFLREAEVLVGLSHPALVRYVAHGWLDGGRPFLALEWMEGEDLRSRLTRGPLEPRETMALLQRVAAGLAYAHARGLVHRDVKPSNLFLVDGSPARCTLLDFGIARRIDATRITQTGGVIGTLGYLAPEQASGAPGSSPAVDVFGLGCVAFECLTGRRAFDGQNGVALLAKLLLEPPPRLAEVRPDLPAELDVLLARLLARDPLARLPDGAAVLAAVADATAALEGHPSRRASYRELTSEERRVESVLLVGPPPDGFDPAVPRLEGVPVPVLDVVARLGGEVHALASGDLLVRIESAEEATDRAARYAGCALRILDAAPGARVVLATGRTEHDGPQVVGPVIDRAASLLSDATFVTTDGIRVDSVSANLLVGRFEIEGDGDALVLRGRRSVERRGGAVLGRPTPFVGRRRELATLERAFEEALEDGVARAVLVTGSAGIGKSRLRAELVDRLAGRDRVEVLVARAEPLSAGSPLALLRQLLRAAVGPDDREATARFDAALGPTDAAWGTPFLRELLSPGGFPAEGALRSARNDARLMQAWTERAFAAWFAARASRATPVVVLEDLHWGDAASIEYLTRAAEAAAHGCLLVALARPEVREPFPELFAELGVEELHLAPLSEKASLRVVHAVLGDALPTADAEALVRRSTGNPLLLEELLRHALTGDGSEELPESVLAMIQARLDRLEPRARRILRACSVCGDAFPAELVRELAGGRLDDVRDQLDALVRRELLKPRLGLGLGGAPGWTFRHALVRDAVYETLTTSDRQTGHALVGRWLAKQPAVEPLLVVRHLELGARPDLAVPHRRRAARAALDAGETSAALALVDEALAHAAAEDRGPLLSLRAEVLGRRYEWREAAAAAAEAFPLLPQGSADWSVAAGLRILGSGDEATLTDVALAMTQLEGEPDPSGRFGWSTMIAVSGLVHSGHLSFAFPLLERLERGLARQRDPDPVALAWSEAARATTETFCPEPDLLRQRALLLQATDRFRRIGDHVGLAMVPWLAAWIELELGRLEAAEALCLESLRSTARVENDYLADWARYMHATALGRGRRYEPALALCHELLGRHPSGILGALTHARLARIHLDREERAEAQAQAELAIEKSAVFVNPRILGHTVRARLALHRGDPAAALDDARVALASGDNGGDPLFLSFARLTEVEAALALGDLDAFGAAAHAAADRLRRMAAPLAADPELARGFLEAVPEHARTLELERLALARASHERR